MSFETSLQSVTDFLEKSQDLVQEVRDTDAQAAADIKLLADKVDANQKQAKDLAASLGNQFQVSKSAATKAKQQDLLNKISDKTKSIEQFKDSPELTTNLIADRGTLYVALANTFDDTVGTLIQFTPDEITDINNLLKQAALDADTRQKWANVLNASVQLAELALKVAVKVAAA